MATSEQFLTYVLEQLSDVEGVRTRPMMGEYLLYLRDRLAGGICDNRLMIKPVSAARALLPGGLLLISGILDVRWPEVRDKIEELGFEVIEILEESEWVGAAVQYPQETGF